MSRSSECFSNVGALPPPIALIGKSVISISLKLVLATIQSVTTNTNSIAHLVHSMTSHGFSFAYKKLTTLTLVVCSHTLHSFVAEDIICWNLRGFLNGLVISYKVMNFPSDFRI